MATTTSAKGETAAGRRSPVTASISGGRPGPSPCVHVTYSAWLPITCATSVARATSVSVCAAGRCRVGITASGEVPSGLRAGSQLLTLSAVIHSSRSGLDGCRSSFQPTRARPYVAAMPLTLITGPANAAKAGAVFERLRAAIARDPVLVVPPSADAAHYARELAGAGVVFGADVTTFPRLMRDIARTAGVRGRPLGRLARDRVVRAAIRDTELRALAASSTGPGFAEALGDLFTELQ